MGCDKEESRRSKSSVLKCFNDLYFNGHDFQFIDKKYQEGHHYVPDITRSSGDSFTKVTLFQPTVTRPWLLMLLRPYTLIVNSASLEESSLELFVPDRVKTICLHFTLWSLIKY